MIGISGRIVRRRQVFGSGQALESRDDGVQDNARCQDAHIHQEALFPRAQGRAIGGHQADEKALQQVDGQAQGTEVEEE